MPRMEWNMKARFGARNRSPHAGQGSGGAAVELDFAVVANVRRMLKMVWGSRGGGAPSSAWIDTNWTRDWWRLGHPGELDWGCGADVPSARMDSWRHFQRAGSPGCARGSRPAAVLEVVAVRRKHDRRHEGETIPKKGSPSPKMQRVHESGADASGGKRASCRHVGAGGCCQIPSLSSLFFCRETISRFGAAPAGRHRGFCDTAEPVAGLSRFRQRHVTREVPPSTRRCLAATRECASARQPNQAVTGLDRGVRRQESARRHVNRKPITGGSDVCNRGERPTSPGQPDVMAWGFGDGGRRVDAGWWPTGVDKNRVRRGSRQGAIAELEVGAEKVQHLGLDSGAGGSAHRHQAHGRGFARAVNL